MRRKHDYAALLKYMRMLDNGYSIHYIHKKFGINSEQLSRTRELYLLNGNSSLQQKVRFEATPELKYHIISDIIKNHLPLREASLKFEVSIVRLGVWLKIAKEQGIDESGYRVITNTGSDAGQTVYHMHFHIIGKQNLGEKLI